MNREVRRKDRTITQEEAMELLKNSEYGYLSTVGPEGLPYGIPLSYVLMGNHICFHCALEGHKLDNIAFQPNVSFCVVGETKPVHMGSFSTLYESAVAFGKAEQVVDETQKYDILTALCQRYLPEHMEKADEEITRMMKATGVYRIAVERVTGKAKRMPPQ